MPTGMKYDDLKIDYAILQSKDTSMQHSVDTQVFCYRLLEAYSRCSFTESVDQLVALSRIA